jgi:hypothetical protein
MGPPRILAGISVVYRLLTLRKQIEEIARVATDAAVITWALIALVLWIGLDHRRAGPGAEFEPTAVAIIALYACAVLGVAFAIMRSLRPTTGYRPVLFTVVALLPIVVGAGFVIDLQWHGAAALWACGFLALYGLAYLANAIRSLAGALQPRAALVTVIALAALFPLARIADLRPWLWTPAAAADEAADSDDSQTSPLVAESLLFDERTQIDAAVDAMTPGLEGSPAVYFVGFAGVGEEHVFAEEIKLAARIVDERFGTLGHQLLLINDRRDLDTYPIATTSGLAYALKAIAAKMNPDRDILFLSISSHGAADASVSVSHAGLQLEQLSDDDLAAALGESGIKRRIIVISACYAGAFIEPLKDPNTVVIAAAAPDKTSFGCSDDRDLTYFGEAFYRDALPQAKTLQDAFQAAKAAIAVREREEQETPSDPQAYFGTQISAVLERNPMRIQPRGAALHAD